MSISDEAVEAAAEAVWEHGEVIQTREYAAELARAALEAAALHLMAAAWDECASSLVYEDGSKVEIATNTNPYRSAGVGE
jgi:hypothetical protein